MGLCTPQKILVSYTKDVQVIDIGSSKVYDSIEIEYYKLDEYQYILTDSVLKFLISYPIDMKEFLKISTSKPLCILDDSKNTIGFKDFILYDKTLISINIILWVCIIGGVIIGIKRMTKNR